MQVSTGAHASLRFSRSIRWLVACEGGVVANMAVCCGCHGAHAAPRMVIGYITFPLIEVYSLPAQAKPDDTGEVAAPAATVSVTRMVKQLEATLSVSSPRGPPPHCAARALLRAAGSPPGAPRAPAASLPGALAGGAGGPARASPRGARPRPATASRDAAGAGADGSPGQASSPARGAPARSKPDGIVAAASPRGLAGKAHALARDCAAARPDSASSLHADAPPLRTSPVSPLGKRCAASAGAGVETLQGSAEAPRASPATPLGVWRFSAPVAAAMSRAHVRVPRPASVVRKLGGAGEFGSPLAPVTP